MDISFILISNNQLLLLKRAYTEKDLLLFVFYNKYNLLEYLLTNITKPIEISLDIILYLFEKNKINYVILLLTYCNFINYNEDDIIKMFRIFINKNKSKFIPILDLFRNKINIVDINRFRINILIRIHGPDAYNQPILIYALLFNNEEIIEYLLKIGANPNEPNNYGYLAINYALEFKLENIVDILIKYGANINIQSFHRRTYIIYDYILIDNLDIYYKLLMHPLIEYNKNKILTYMNDYMFIAYGKYSISYINYIELLWKLIDLNIIRFRDIQEILFDIKTYNTEQEDLLTYIKSIHDIPYLTTSSDIIKMLKEQNGLFTNIRLYNTTTKQIQLANQHNILLLPNIKEYHLIININYWINYLPIYILEDFNELKKDMIALFCAIYFYNGICTKTNDLCKVRFLTNAHGLRPIRIRLNSYLVYNDRYVRKLISIIAKKLK